MMQRENRRAGKFIILTKKLYIYYLSLAVRPLSAVGESEEAISELEV